MTKKLSKGTAFATFILSLLCGSLVCTSLVTNHWIETRPWRKLNPEASSGRIYFGLLHGRKELNVAFGVRPYDIIVSNMIEKDPHIMSWNLWCATLVSTILALLFSAFSVFLSALNSILTPQVKMLSVYGIYFLNTVTLSMCLISICTWVIQFQTKLYTNVLPEDDLNNHWTSDKASTLGYSFWLVAIAAFLSIINILLIKWNMIRDKKENQKVFIDCSEEKSVGAIMLY